MLTMVTLNDGVQSPLPAVSYAKVFILESQIDSQTSLSFLLIQTMVQLIYIFFWYLLSFQAVDIWMHISLTFVIFSLMQGALVNYIDRKDEQNKTASRSCLSCKKNKASPSQADNGTRGKLLKLDKHLINKISRILFPFLYLVFNIIYWMNI